MPCAAAPPPPLSAAGARRDAAGVRLGPGPAAQLIFLCEIQTHLGSRAKQPEPRAISTRLLRDVSIALSFRTVHAVWCSPPAPHRGEASSRPTRGVAPRWQKRTSCMMRSTCSAAALLLLAPLLLAPLPPLAALLVVGALLLAAPVFARFAGGSAAATALAPCGRCGTARL